MTSFQCPLPSGNGVRHVQMDGAARPAQPRRRLGAAAVAVFGKLVVQEQRAAAELQMRVQQPLTVLRRMLSFERRSKGLFVESNSRLAVIDDEMGDGY